MSVICPEIKVHVWRRVGIGALLFIVVPAGIFLSVSITHKRNIPDQQFIRKGRLRNDIWCEEWEDGIIYCRWNRCEADTADFFIEFVKESPRHKGTIVDLQGNAGGLLPEGIAFAGLWYEEGAPLLTLYREEGGPAVALVKSLSERELKSPVVAIIDGNTASTAEVVAGLIGALPNGCLVGQKTAGDPVARVDIMAGDPPCSMEMRLTIQLQGRVVHHDGIEPDFHIQPGKYFRARCLERSLLILNTPPGDNL